MGRAKEAAKDGRGRRWRRLGTWECATAAAGLLTSLLLLFPGLVPNGGPRLGSLLETFLPWLGLAVLPLVPVALVRRSAVAVGAALLPVAAWTVAYGGTFFADENAAYDLTVLQHNVSDENRDVAGTARALVRERADLVALQEVTDDTREAYRTALADEYPHHAVVGTVGLWSRHPLVDARPVDVKPQGIPDGWNRGLRATARTPHGEVAVYVAHLPSVRVSATGFTTERRDESAGLLAAAIRAEEVERLVLLGDLNSTTRDRGLDPVHSQLNAPKDPFAFSWPASRPLARIDQVLVRSGQVTQVSTLERTGSDHLPVRARIAF
ncbi:endonuclease/exonuclease/phosphatase family protein [Streptomyces sp. NPDC017979]|uniref:endonuclease/exonuclease/phosphatase family protein n=1 Tax=Streptomyces sp. NPDC017979 TaxID=3365024 RepID=UPI0037AC37A2